MEKAHQLVQTPFGVEDVWSPCDPIVSQLCTPALAPVSQLLQTVPPGAGLARRHIELRQGDRSIIIADEYHSPQKDRAKVAYVVEEETTDKLTIFCYGMAASAIVLVVTLVVLTILHCT